ncbi:uncharacterized protein DS421_11g331400 [Arachis hypogaea]|nr:uncharacterized protein DS421_11g331400 [Arachis hypogaea]
MASSSSRRRKGKQPVEAKPPTYDDKRFKSQFHESRYHRLMEAKDVILEIGFRLKEGEYPIMRRIIEQRRWKLLCEPLTDINATMIREFYANAVRPSKTSRPYKSYVRGVDVDFSPSAIMKGLEQKADSEVEEGLLMLLDSDLPALKVDFLELQNSKWRSSNCVGK